MGVYQRGSIWWIRYSHKGKIIRETSNSENKTVAKKLLSIRKAEIAQGKYKIKSNDSQILFQDYANEFLRWAKIHRKPKSFLRYQTSVNQLIPYFGKIKLASISKKDIERYKANRIAQVSGSTINRDLACLKKMYNNAISDGIVEINPVIGVEFFKEPRRSPNFLSDDEAVKLIEACDTDAIKTFVILGLNTGMRLNELLSLKWDDVNLDDRLIVLKDTKNNKEDSIPLNDTALEQLQQQNRISEYVVCKSDGSKYQNIRKSWIRVLKKANLRKLSPHALRHTFATMLVREGADLMAVKELGRWSNLKLVERYAHVANDHRTRVISKLDNKFQGDTNGDTMDDN
ncbi:MAG: site-specific integrase [bacterium]|jgi:site-specific recombinase XerD|nr:site-specific integrase [bacterium]